VPRRVSLPGADELFRTTGGAALQAPQPRQHPGGPGSSAGEGRNGTPAEGRLRPVPTAEQDDDTDGSDSPARSGRGGDTADQADGERGAEARTGPAVRHEDGTEHGGRDVGRDIPPSRRPLASERPGAPAGRSDAGASVTMTVPPPPQQPASAQPPITAQPQPQQARRKAPRQNRRPSGRERHDEKITVYVSAEELMDLEHARLVLRGEHGLAIDRGRIVREAVAVVLADLESRGDASILVRRLRGR
jgi:hypothetical protein